MEQNNRILLVDDNEAIHEDIEAILTSHLNDTSGELQNLEDDLFGVSESDSTNVILNNRYVIDHAYQGEEAIDMVEKAHQKGKPYSLIFMDVRMPPGIDGIKTIQRIWKKYPYTEVVICTAYSDYSWDQIVNNLGYTDKLLFMKKPFDATALKQTALTLTKKWQLHQQTLEYTEKLESEVKERTKELNKLVIDFKKMKDKAEHASASKSVFLANMSHEIRTPMNGVMGLNNLLLETELSSEQRELSEMVKNSATSLLRVINDILDFSKIEAGKMDVENVPVNVNNLIREVVQIVEFSSNEKGLSINYKYDERIPDRLIGDPVRLRQILLNYGSNAVKFTKKGRVTFEARLLESDGENFVLKLLVSDTGIGIPKEKQSEVFKSFTQADSTTTRRFGGTGLGLAICRQLAELMNGEVGVDSTPGEGSVFWFKVPLKKCNNKVIAENETPVSDQVLTLKNNLPVLVAEDNKMNQIVARKLLEKEGFTVEIVVTGAEALKAVQTKDYAFLLMDIQMPEMDGYQATFKIREWERKTGGHIPIIALTASAMEEDRQLCLKAGMDEYVSKPVDKKKLFEAMQKAELIFKKRD